MEYLDSFVKFWRDRVGANGRSPAGITTLAGRASHLRAELSCSPQMSYIAPFTGGACPAPTPEH